jgi:hypothetical protein
MNTTTAEIRALATHLGFGPGELLRIAREVSEDANLPSIAHLTGRQRNRLHFELKIYQALQEGFAAIAAQEEVSA